MKYMWNDIRKFESLNLKKVNLDFKVLNEEIYDDRDYPYKSNFKHPWNEWKGVEVDYKFNETIITGYRGKTVWYIPSINDETAKILKVDQGKALKIIKYPVCNTIQEEYERLIQEFTIQKILSQNKMAPDVFEIVIVINSVENTVNWFNEKYYHPAEGIYFACIVEHLKNDGLPQNQITLNSDFLYVGEMIEKFKRECLKLRILPYDLGLGNLFYNEKTKKICVIDVHKWKRTYEIKQVNIPKYIQIELNNTCNATCVIAGL